MYSLAILLVCFCEGFLLLFDLVTF